MREEMKTGIIRMARLIVCMFALAVAASVSAQTTKWQDLYKVKKKDTIYGIAKKYNVTIDDLMKANPDMQKPDYQLKKGDQLLIPFAAEKKVANTGTTTAAQPSAKSAVAGKTVPGVVRVGVMLPLHNVDGDGQRMIEYYRGILMACDSLKAQGINTRVHAWNVAIDANVKQILNDDNATDCDIIFGPLYTKQVKEMGDFCRKHDIRLVIPFSISGNDVAGNDHIFQVFQSQAQQSESAVGAFVGRFKGCHTVIVDCNDTTSKKGVFTFALRKRLESQGMTYSVTNLKSSDTQFAKAFSQTLPNVVVLNTGRSPELNSTLAKLNVLKATLPKVKISLFGYTDWLMYTKVYKDYFYKYDAYIPTTFYYNAASAGTANIERAYRSWFKSDMRAALPRFAITGYDQAQFFIRGIHQYGAKFRGTQQQSAYRPLQTPLKFKYVNGGGMQNRSFMLVHYTPAKYIETISY